ncbi:hypothetical protein P3S67_011196 [Capsicum chacoense]
MLHDSEYTCNARVEELVYKEEEALNEETLSIQIKAIENEEVLKMTRKANRFKGKRVTKHFEEKIKMDVDGATGIHFNEEIVVDIISRLPVRSHLRFKCVSNLTRITKFLQKFFFLKDMFTSHLSSLTSASLSLAQFTEDVQKLDWLYDGKPWSCKIYCCYDGLVLMGIRKYDDINHLILFLWNPSKRESVVLPSTKFLPSEAYTCGLGCDSTSCDYMILKIGYQSCSEILALKSGSWRIIGKATGIYSSWLSDMDSLAFVHGAFHWLGLSRNESVTSYDISNEVFKEIPLPDGMFVVPDMNMSNMAFLYWEK